MPDLDPLGRQTIQQADRNRIRDVFDGLAGRGALLIIADTTGTRAHLAANLNGTWRVAGGLGFDWKEKKPEGFVGIEARW